jgi:hypothetical protein
MRVITVTIILMIIVFAGVPTARGQSASPDLQRIRQLREEIQKRETAQIPDDLIELNQSKLIERRAELRTLLKNEMAKVRKHQADMATFITPQETQRINDLLQTYTAEVDRLGADMQRDLVTDASAGSPPPLAPVAELTSPTSAAGNGGGNTPGPVEDGSGSSSTGGSGGSIVTPPTSAPAFTAGSAGGNASLDCDKVLAQSVPASEIDQIICGLVREARDRKVNALDLGSDDRFELVKVLIAKRFTPKYLVEASEARLDKQLGASSVNGVSPSLVTHGGVPAILGFAVENGGLAQTTNNNAITFRGNPIGLLNALRNKGFLENVKESESDPLQRFLKKTSFAFTFNTDRGREPGTFTGSSQQLSSVSARIELINRRVPSLYIKDWENFIAKEAQNLSDVIDAQARLIVDRGGRWIDPVMKSWWDQTQVDLAAASDVEVSGVLQAALNNIPSEDLSQQTILALQSIEEALRIYQSGRDSVVEKINSGTVLTLEYLNKREVNEPDTSNFMVIAEKGTGGGKVNFTFNGSLTMFNNLTSLRNFVNANPTLPQPRRVRDFQFAGGIDIPFGNVREFGQFVLFASGKYERLLENATTDLGQVLPNTKGDMAHLQLGLKIPIAKSGFKIPVSITFANRTELIKERTVKGNFGFSLDLDTIFSKFKPF